MTAAFDAVFGVFVLSMLVIAGLAVRWGVRRDRAERAARAARAASEPRSDTSPGPS